MSGAALPPAPPADTATAQDDTAPTPDELAAVDPSQTTVIAADPTADPAPEVPVVPEQPVDPVEPPVTDTAPTAAPDTPVPSPEPSAPEAPAPSPEKRSRAADPQVAPEAVTPMLVPDPTTSQSVITVKVGGVRTTLTQVAPLAGVTLQLFDGTDSGPTTARPDAWATCVSDAAGDCSFVVPTTQTGGANRDARFWVKQAGAAPSGYFSNASLAVGSDPVTRTYQFRTGTQLRGGATYTSTTDFMVGSGNGSTSSGGIWQDSLSNPGLPPKCGLRVALVLDLSGSVSPYISNLRAAASTFVDSLTGTPSSVALFTFAQVAPASTGANLGLTPVSTAAGAKTVKDRIATYTAGDSTNWDRGLYQVAASATAFDIAVVITDGNPTVYANNEGPGNVTRFREVENGIFSSNAIKAKSTRVVAVGVGDGIAGSPDNLRAISGPASGSDYYQTPDYASAGAALRALALGSCAGSVSVVKQVVPAGTTGETITGATPAGGWAFSAATATAGVTPTTQSGTTAAGTGAVNFPLSYAGGTSTATVTVAETQQSGYSLVTQAGKRAVCKDIGSGAAVTVTNDAASTLGFSVAAPATSAISCIVYNRAPQPQSSIRVDKQWVVNGTPFANGNQPIGINAALTLAGTAQDWGTPRTGLTSGSSVAIAESTTFTGRDLCTATSSRITQKNGATVDLPVPSTVTLTAGDTNSYVITNVVTCTAQLTLVKQVAGGPALPTSWALDAVAPDGALPGPSGATGTPAATAAVTPQVRYPLVESGSGLYTQTIRPGGTPIAPSTGSWQCEQVTAAGAVVPGYNDGINGGVTVPLGFRVRCTAVNQSATLTLVKQVVNDNGGTAVPADWTLKAAPTGSVPADVVAQQVTGSTTGGTIQVRPGTTYALSETGPAGYQQASLKCSTGPGGAYVDATTVTVGALDAVTCVFVNDDRGATLTLVKAVDNGTTGGTAVPTAWTLTAGGPTPLSGATGAPAVTAANVNVGTYTLGETGPGGYTASAWSCTAGTLTGASLVLRGGDAATCTITNTAVQPRLTLVKAVVDGSTGATAAPSAWTLSATGPSTVTGAGNSPAVTSAAAKVGTYTLSESGGPAGYSASAWVCTGGASATGTSVTLALGSSATCTITNTAVAPRLTLVKEVDLSYGGSATADDWTLGFDGPVTGSGTTGQAAVTSVAVPVGGYDLAESGGPAGYTASDWTCTDGTLEGSTVTLALGDDATCTLTNSDTPARLTLVKTVVAGTTGSLNAPSDWTLTATPVDIEGQGAVTGNGSGSAAQGGVEQTSVFSGSYTLAEDGPIGFVPSQWVCEGGILDGSTVTVPTGSTVVCTITNTAVSPTLTLVKEVDDGDGAGTAEATDWTLLASGPTPVSGATGSAAVSDAPVKVGDYTLTESGPTGYTAGDWTCVGGTLDGDVLTLTEGQDATCTIVNTAVAPTLTLVKVVDEAGTGATTPPQAWTLVASGGEAGDISGTSGSPEVTGATAQATRYTLTEQDGPDGYTASAWQCVGAVSTSGSTVELAAGSDATCTITNTAAPSTLTLVKVVDVGATGATDVASDWTLTADGPGTLSGSSGSAAVTSVTVPVGSYDLTEDGPEGYTASGWDCGEAAVDGSTVTVGLDEDVTCTVTNTAIPSTLTLVKEVVATNGGSAAPDDWTLAASDVLSGTSGVTGDVPVGTLDLSESGGPSGYLLTALTCTTATGTSVGSPRVTVGLDEDVVCTFTNTSQPAHLGLSKVVDAAGSGSAATAEDWTLTATPDGIDGQDPVAGAGGFPSTDVISGSYDLSEAGPGGWDASDWQCDLGDGASLDDGRVTLDPGASADCTLTNTARTPRLTLVKEVINDDGGTQGVDDFTLVATGTSTVLSGLTGDPSVTDAAAPVGDYTLTELHGSPLAYTLTSLVCTDGESTLSTNVDDPRVSLALGDDVTCTFTNDDVPGRLTLVKVVSGGDTGSTKTPSDWTLTATPARGGPVTGNGSGTADGGVFEVSVPAGDYTLDESGPSGFEAGEWVCQGGVLSDGTVAVPNGGNVVCTITNTATSPHLTLVKVVDDGETSGTAVPQDWTLTATGPTPVTGTTGAPAVTAAPVQVGTYTLAESTGPVGYTPSDWVCEGGTLADGAVTLAEGEDAVCTITNTAQPSTWTVAKSSDPVSGSTVLPGSSITYTVTVVHTGGVLPTGVVVTDDLSDVLDDATLVGDPVTAAGSADLVGDDLVWTVGTFTGTQTVSYTVLVDADAFGATLHNVVTPPEGSTCDGSCETTHETPVWELHKTSDPADGARVTQGQTITYTLHAANTGGVPVVGATAIDTLVDVLDDATLVEPLSPGLTYDPATQQLTWQVPTLEVGAEESTVTYAVVVDPDAYEATLRNVVVPGTPGGSCPGDEGPVVIAPRLAAGDEPLRDDCVTTHETGRLDLAVVKTHAPLEDGSVDSGRGRRVDYSVAVSNVGADAAQAATLSDPLPSSVTYLDGTLVTPDGWVAEIVDGVLTATHDGAFEPGAVSTFTYSVIVGDVPRVTPGGVYENLVNTACVRSEGTDSDPSDNCSTDTVPVRSVAVQALAVCVDDTPIVTYRVTPTNVSGQPTVALIWWTARAFEARDTTIDASDTAAILADGASQVNRIAVPAGWVSGETITGQQLWPGAAVDAAGKPTTWPGWTERSDGTWFLDPSAPFYDLRGETVVEVRVNPSTGSTLAYPPATPDCDANPPVVVPPTPTPGPVPRAGAAAGPWHLPETGAEIGAVTLLGTGLLVLGAVLVSGRRRRGETTRRTGGRAQ